MAQDSFSKLYGECRLKESTLNLRPREQFTIAQYRIGINDGLLDILDSSDNLWLFGSPSVGKTHLANAVVAGSEDGILVDDPSYALIGLERFSLIVFDNVEQWIGTRSLESQLVGLYEQLGANGGRMIVTSRLWVNEIDFVLADLESRMRLFSRYELRPLPVDERIRLFSDIAADRGIEITKEVSEYLQKRIGRSQDNLLATLDLLDHKSIVEQRRITVPFIKKALKL